MSLHHPLDALPVVEVLDRLEDVVEGSEDAWTGAIRIGDAGGVVSPGVVGLNHNPGSKQ